MSKFLFTFWGTLLKKMRNKNSSQSNKLYNKRNIFLFKPQFHRKHSRAATPSASRFSGDFQFQRNSVQAILKGFRILVKMNLFMCGRVIAFIHHYQSNTQAPQVNDLVSSMPMTKYYMSIIFKVHSNSSFSFT